MTESGTNRANTLSQIRNTIQNEAAKGLLFVNGGSAIAIATLVQSVWDTWPTESLRLALLGVVPPLLGIALALASLIVRYVNSLRPASTRVPNPWWYAILVLEFGSILLFLLGMSLVVYAGLRALEFS